MEINLSLGFISYLVSGLLFLLILVIYFVGFEGKLKAKPFLLLVSATFVWSGLLTMSQIGASIAFKMIVVSELLRYFTWFYVLQSAAGLYVNNPFSFRTGNLFSPLNIAVLFVIAIVTLSFNDYFNAVFQIQKPVTIQIGWMLLFSILGLVLVEQLFRNTASGYRRSISFLCISAGAIFIYDLFVFSNALLAQAIDYEFWSARGIVNVLIVPTLLIAAARNPGLAPHIHVSRQFVFHSTTLFSVGTYLLLMSLAGFYVKESSGEWGKILQASFLFASLLLLAVLFFSPKLKIRIKRYLSYSFSNKYDYREEWNRFSRTLLTHDPEISIYKRALQAIAQIVDSQGATLWIKDNNHFFIKTDWQQGVVDLQPEAAESVLIKFIYKKEKLFSKKEFGQFCESPEKGEHWFSHTDNSWLIVPLWINEELFGFVHLMAPSLKSGDAALGIEDIDLLNTIAHHVSLSLFLKETDNALQQAQKFTDMNQMTAFLMHDLKTVLSQLTLLVENSAAHKNNPDFIDDMINTVEHTTHKMHRVMQLLKNPDQLGEASPKPILEVIDAVVESFRHHQICPVVNNVINRNPVIFANQEQLYSAMKNIVQNAVESINKTGKVEIELSSIVDNQLIIDISDDGKGMSQEFIAERLFRPFDSTKGVSGMGMGVFQSREYFRSINGDLKVVSKENAGSCFTIQLPVEL
ncbi:MAG: PEP-CTERM system histidine kinase PrsK [Gammaproteobacteria bacterium]|nr:PEP-CTERM system histidine kinase PrsK [Gammaproteobacteria bacterium]